MKTQIPKGTLIPIGGGEDREESKDVLCRIIAETGKKNPNICLITLATDVPEKVAEVYNNAFNDLGISTLSIIHYTHRNEANTEENIKKVRDCDLILITGGKQLKLSTLLGGTDLLHIIKERYYDEPNFVVAGTSAGAAAMSNTMIISGSSEEALMKGSLHLTNGLDLINSFAIDTHFTQRGRTGRLIEMATANPGILGLGIGEDTCLIIKKYILEVCGAGLAIIVDGDKMGYTNLTEVKDGEPITVENIIVHVLGPGKKFIISERKLEVKE